MEKMQIRVICDEDKDGKSEFGSCLALKIYKVSCFILQRFRFFLS